MGCYGFATEMVTRIPAESRTERGTLDRRLYLRSILKPQPKADPPQAEANLKTFLPQLGSRCPAVSANTNRAEVDITPRYRMKKGGFANCTRSIIWTFWSRYGTDRGAAESIGQIIRTL